MSEERRRISREEAASCYFAATTGMPALFYELERLGLIDEDETFHDIAAFRDELIAETRQQLSRALRREGEEPTTRSS